MEPFARNGAFITYAAAILCNEHIILKAKLNVFLPSFAVDVQIYEAFVHLVCTSRHLLRIAHIVLLPVAKFIIRARLPDPSVALPYNHLAHLFDEVGLPA